MWWLSCLGQKAMSFNGVAIVSVKGNDYREIVFCILEKLENEAVNIIKKSDLKGKSWTL